MTPKACFVSAIRPARDVRTFHKEARSLAVLGWEVTVIGRDPGPARVEDGIRIVPLPDVRGVRRPLLQARALRHALAARADVYQVTDLELLPAALLLKRLTRRPVVYDCIEDYPAYMRVKAWIPPSLRPFAARSVERLERFVVPRLDAVVTADEGTARRLRRYHGSVNVLHNFPRRDDFRVADGPRPDHVLYHGSLPPYHLRALVAIAAELTRHVPDAHTTVVGAPDSGEAEAEFAQALSEHGLVGRVTLRPRVPFAEVPALLGAARTGVVPLPDVPKFRTNVPMKLFEFLAAGVPAVTSDLPPARELLDQSDAAILVPPGDHRAFGEALAGLLRDPDAAAAQAARGLAVVRERCHWEREERRLAGLYGALLCGTVLAAPAEVRA